MPDTTMPTDAMVKIAELVTELTDTTPPPAWTSPRCGRLRRLVCLGRILLMTPLGHTSRLLSPPTFSPCSTDSRLRRRKSSS